jgi:hypothetical protein
MASNKNAILAAINETAGGLKQISKDDARLLARQI